MDISQVRGIIHFLVVFINLAFAFILWSKGKSRAIFHWGLTAFFSAVYAFTWAALFFFEENKLIWVRATWLGIFKK